MTLVPKVTPAATHSSGRRGSSRPLADDFSLLGLRSRPQTELRTGFQVRQGLAQRRSQKPPSRQEPRERRSRHLGWAGSPHSCLESAISSENRADTDGPRLLFGNQKILATSKTLWKNPTPNPYNPFFFEMLWLLALWSLQL